MNKQRRKAIASILEELSATREKLITISEEENDYFDNMPEGIRFSKKGDAVEEYIGLLEDTITLIEEAEETLEEITEG